MKKLFIFLLIAVMISCNPAAKKRQTVATNDQPEYSLELAWQSDTLLRTPESVLIDRKNDILYVSNVNMNPWLKDDNGFISKMDRLGNIIDLKWAEGLHGPKGMGISGGSLFVADIDALVEISLETGETINRFEVDPNPELNDVTVADDGTVYVSGSGSDTIYRLGDDGLVAVHTGAGGERFNGLYHEGNRMLLITSASSLLKAIDLPSGEVTVIAGDLGHGDAIAPVGDGAYLTTSWKGAVFYVAPDGLATKLLDTEALEENAADADFCIEQQILYVPTFYKNQVKAYRLVNNNK